MCIELFLKLKSCQTLANITLFCPLFPPLHLRRRRRRRPQNASSPYPSLDKRRNRKSDKNGTREEEETSSLAEFYRGKGGAGEEDPFLSQPTSDPNISLPSAQQRPKRFHFLRNARETVIRRRGGKEDTKLDGKGEIYTGDQRCREDGGGERRRGKEEDGPLALKRSIHYLSSSYPSIPPRSLNLYNGIISGAIFAFARLSFPSAPSSHFPPSRQREEIQRELPCILMKHRLA